MIVDKNPQVIVGKNPAILQKGFAHPGFGITSPPSVPRGCLSVNIGEKGQPLFKNKTYQLPDCGPEAHLQVFGGLVSLYRQTFSATDLVVSALRANPTEQQLRWGAAC